jgi:hypothetical protein
LGAIAAWSSLGQSFLLANPTDKKIVETKTRFRIIVNQIIVNYRKEPQGLKPEPIQVSYGTTEVAP